MRYFYLIFFLTCVTVIGLAGFRGSKSRQPPIELFADMVRHEQGAPAVAERFLCRRPQFARAAGRHGGAQPALRNATGNCCSSTAGRFIPMKTRRSTPGGSPGTTNFIDTNPLAITRQLLDRGQERYQIYCLPCHGPAATARGSPANTGWSAWRISTTSGWSR